MSSKTIDAEAFDTAFDDGEDIDAHVDWSTARRPGLAKRRVNIDFTDQMVRRLDIEAQRRGVTRQALIKMWIADRLDQAAACDGGLHFLGNGRRRSPAIHRRVAGRPSGHWLSLRAPSKKLKRPASQSGAHIRIMVGEARQRSRQQDEIGDGGVEARIVAGVRPDVAGVEPVELSMAK